MALIVAMDRGRRHGTVRAACSRGRGPKPKEHVFPLNSHAGEPHGAGWWEQTHDASSKLLGFIAHNLLSYQEIPQLRSISPSLRKTPHYLRISSALNPQ
jgi:hypothetical protein